ncbi:MAG: response regulator transcription factor [Desulfobacteraceae bacterium]|nr:response regulator transcription factor [Desulfobacteraceae bacterium]
MYSVLIIEKNEFFRRSFREILKLYIPTLTISEFSDGTDALSTIESTPPDMIFIGIRLSGKNGLELAREIKAKYPKVAVSILTSYDMPEYRNVAKRYGADHFLLKDSMTGAQIAALVKESADRKRRRPPGRNESQPAVADLAEAVSGH